MITPLHPLSAKTDPLTRAEWLELLAYEGLVFVSDDSADLPLLREMESDGLVDITSLHGGLGVVLT